MCLTLFAIFHKPLKFNTKTTFKTNNNEQSLCWRLVIPVNLRNVTSFSWSCPVWVSQLFCFGLFMLKPIHISIVCCVLMDLSLDYPLVFLHFYFQTDDIKFKLDFNKIQLNQLKTSFCIGSVNLLWHVTSSTGQVCRLLVEDYGFYSCTEVAWNVIQTKLNKSKKVKIVDDHSFIITNTCIYRKVWELLESREDTTCHTRANVVCSLVISALSLSQFQDQNRHRICYTRY